MRRKLVGRARRWNGGALAFAGTVYHARTRARGADHRGLLSLVGDLNMRMCGLVAIVAALAAAPPRRCIARRSRRRRAAPLVPIATRATSASIRSAFRRHLHDRGGDRRRAGHHGGRRGVVHRRRHDRFTTFDFKVRYYPGEVVLRGFSVGVTLRLSQLQHAQQVRRRHPGPLSAPTIGLIADYNWLLGRGAAVSRRHGRGRKRVLATSDDRDRVGLDRAVFTARFTVGLAF